MRALFPVIGLAATLTATPAAAQLAECSKFRDSISAASGDLKASFVRPLVVGGANASDVERYDLVSQARIDGSLRCRGETIVSFEATIHLPAAGGLNDMFARAQEAALVAGLGWSHPRARAKVGEISQEAEDYLRGSIERGDHVVAGKLEEHLSGGVDIGAIHTRTERSFILLNTN